jgi:hypothetical protein
LIEIGTLPAGLSFTDNGNGTATLSGDPEAGTGGVYTVTVVANNSGGSAFQKLAITVDEAAAITSATSATFTVGESGSFEVTTVGYPVPSISETGTLPPGVTFTDNGNGTATLAGTPGAGSGGAYGFGIGAQNSQGTPQAINFTLFIDQPPGFTSGSSATFTVGQAGSFTVVASGYPAPALSEIGALPVGLRFKDNGNGTATISGTPVSVTPDPAVVKLEATNAAGSTATAFSITVTSLNLWLDTANGAVISTSNAGFFGSMASRVLAASVVGMAGTPDGRGYWLVGADGGVFSFGDASFYGSVGAVRLENPVVTLVPTFDGHGYVLVTRNGQLLDFGDATFESRGDYALLAPIVGGSSA